MNKTAMLGAMFSLAMLLISTSVWAGSLVNGLPENQTEA
jgi:hypothetical protein